MAPQSVAGKNGEPMRTARFPRHVFEAGSRTRPPLHAGQRAHFSRLEQDSLSLDRRRGGPRSARIPYSPRYRFAASMHAAHPWADRPPTRLVDSDIDRTCPPRSAPLPSSRSTALAIGISIVAALLVADVLLR